MNGLKELTGAIILAAVDDWRSLCKSAIPSKYCNFAELEEFFESGCCGYIDQDLSKEIYRKLKKERKSAESGNQSVIKRKNKQAYPYVALQGRVVVGCYRSEADAWNELLKRGAKKAI